jgi:hypothetical protein
MSRCKLTNAKGSIGFAIPISRMFTGSVLWRGFIYTLLATFGKILCGIWLVRIALPSLRTPHFIQKLRKSTLISHFKRQNAPQIARGQTGRAARRNDEIELQTHQHERQNEITETPSAAPSQDSSSNSASHQPPPKPLSLYPPSILGLAMVARGEIGFLISSLAQSRGIFSSSTSGHGHQDDQIFLVVTWAIFLCTVIGPLGVGLLVRRVKRLEKLRGESGGRDVMGVWGVG